MTNPEAAVPPADANPYIHMFGAEAYATALQNSFESDVPIDYEGKPIASMQLTVQRTMPDSGFTSDGFRQFETMTLIPSDDMKLGLARTPDALPGAAEYQRDIGKLVLDTVVISGVTIPDLSGAVMRMDYERPTLNGPLRWGTDQPPRSRREVDAAMDLTLAILDYVKSDVFKLPAIERNKQSGVGVALPFDDYRHLWRQKFRIDLPISGNESNTFLMNHAIHLKNEVDRLQAVVRNNPTNSEAAIRLREATGFQSQFRTIMNNRIKR